jgi:hypothetical protein
VEIRFWVQGQVVIFGVTFLKKKGDCLRGMDRMVACSPIINSNPRPQAVGVDSQTLWYQKIAQVTCWRVIGIGGKTIQR